MSSLDHTFFQRLYGAQGVWLWLMAALTVIGSGWTMIPIAGLAALRPMRAPTLKLIGVLAGVAVLVVALKAIIGRVRPCACLGGVHALVFSAPTDPSFPSGHAAGAFAVAAFVAFEARTHPLVKLAVFAIATGIALSRVVLGVHFPSDVIAGAILGTLVSALATRRSFAKT